MRSLRPAALGRQSSLLVALTLAALAGPSSAALAGLALWQVSPGSSSNPQAQYLVLKVTGSCDLSRVGIATEDASGAPLGAFIQLDGAPPLRDGFVYLATQAAVDEYKLPADQLAICASLPLETGRICVHTPQGNEDCVAYGQFTGDNESFGAPTDGLGLDQVLARVGASGNNRIDWQRAGNPNPLTLLAGRVLPPDPVTCAADAGPTYPPDAGLDAAYLHYPDGGACPIYSPDAGSDGGNAQADGGNGGGNTIGGGGGASWPSEPSSGSCCQGSASNAALLIFPLLSIGLPRRRRGRRGDPFRS